MLRSLRAKNIITLLIDLIVASIVVVLGLYLRVGEDIDFYTRGFLLRQELFFTFSAFISNIICNLYRDIWRYFNQDELIRYFKYATLTICIFTLLLFLNNRLESLPRSVIFIDWLLLILLTAAPRIIYKIYLESSITSIFKKTTYLPNPLLIIGVSRSIEMFIDELKRMQNPPYKVMGILDSEQNVKRLLCGVPIIDETKNFKKVIENLTKKSQRPTRILIGSDVLLGGFLQELINLCKELAIPISRLPNITELSHNVKVKGLAIKPIAVEDLLRRSQRNLDFQLIKSMVSKKVILVTGAGGSIGSEIVRQCAQFGAKEIHLLDSSEFLLYEIEQECLRLFPHITIKANLADIRDEREIDDIILSIKPDIVFHAAALKHVPMLEKHKLQAISVNIFGTLNIVKTTLNHKVPQLVFISTDKAVKPLSFMGLTKRVAEMICQLNSGKNTKISIVRFGNVLGSNGSVVPLFEKQIEAGGPITVTHPETTRYFMTIPEAVGLVLQAAALNDAKQHTCRTYILDMGEPVKILDLAEQMIVLAGLKPHIDVKIEFKGLRPGEKLHEVLVLEHDRLTPTVSQDIFLSSQSPIKAVNFNKQLNNLLKVLILRDETKCVKIIKKLIESVKESI